MLRRVSYCFPLESGALSSNLCLLFANGLNVFRVCQVLLLSSLSVVMSMLSASSYGEYWDGKFSLFNFICTGSPHNFIQ